MYGTTADGDGLRYRVFPVPASVRGILEFPIFIAGLRYFVGGAYGRSSRVGVLYYDSTGSEHRPKMGSEMSALPQRIGLFQRDRHREQELPALRHESA
jgi:hypothetical protein